MSATVAWQTTVAATDTGWAAPASNKLVYKAANDNTDDLNNPLIKPSGATPYNSYFKPLKIVVGGTYTSLTNLRVLLSAAYSPATVQMWYKFSASYIDPTASQPPASTTSYTQMSTSPANWTGKVEVSKRVTGAIPETPAMMFCQPSSTLLPTGEIRPRPVMTTLRRAKICTPKAKVARPAMVAGLAWIKPELAYFLLARM